MDKGWDVVGAVGGGDRNKKQQSGYTSFKNLCETENIRYVETDDITSPNVKSLYAEMSPDVCICCGWSQIIPESILEAPSWGTVGLHLSPLPKGRGGAPVNWQIIHGHDKVTATLFRFVPEVDHGDVLGQKSVLIEQRDDISTVYPKLTLVSIDLLDEFLMDLSKRNISATEQSYGEATYYPQRKPDDGLIDWKQSSEFIWNWIRAQTKPYPGAFTFYEGKKLIIWEAVTTDYQIEPGKPGEILKIKDKQGIDVQTKYGIIRLKRVEFEDSPPMWADDTKQRYNLQTGRILGAPRHFPDWLYTGIRDGNGDFRYKTNLSRSESTQIQAVCCSHDTSQAVQIKATLDNDLILNKTVTVSGWYTETINISPDIGPHTLCVNFETNESRENDARYIKIYVNES
jgi:methionyl-tRNA formyltransferase